MVEFSVYLNRLVFVMESYILYLCSEYSYSILFCILIRKNSFANSTDPDETAHDELSHLDLRCLTFCLSNLHMNILSSNSLLTKKQTTNVV